MILMPPLITGLSLSLTLLLGLSFLLCWPSVANTQSVSDNGSQRQQQIKKLQQGLAEQRSRLDTAQRREKSLLAELARLDREVAGQRSQLETLNQSLAQQQAQMELLQNELAQALTIREQSSKHVSRRLAAAYRMGSVGLLNILFTAESLPELLDLQHNFQTILAHDRKIFAAYRENIQRLQTTKEALTNKAQEMLAAREEVKQQEERLRISHQERSNFLHRVQNEKHLHQQALREITQSADRLTNTLAAREQLTAPNTRLAFAPHRPAAANKRAGQGGQLALPVAGVITTHFGQSITGRFGLLSHSRGITFETTKGAKVSSPFAGTVVHAGTMDGYGNVLIIDHGDHYFSLLARLARITVKEGDRLEKGDKIGIAGDKAGEGAGEIYLEFRRGVIPLDPLPWFHQP